MNLNDFIAKQSGQPVDTDGSYPNQCMDLMHEYVKDVLGLPVTFLSQPAAKDVFLNYPNENGASNFTQIFNTPTGVPQPGDIMFWGSNVGEYGHVAVFVSGTADSFNSFDANWPLGSLPHLQNHNYNGVLGWFRPLTSPGSTSPISNTEFMTFELLQKTGDSTVYFRVWPFAGTDSVLIPIDSSDDLHNYFGPNPTIKQVTDFKGEGISVFDLIGSKVNPLADQINTLNLKVDQLVHQLADAQNSLKAANDKITALQAGAEVPALPPTPPLPTAPAGDTFIPAAAPMPTGNDLVSIIIRLITKYF